MNKNVLNYFLYALLSMVITYSSHSQAQPVADDVLDDIVISSSEYTGIIKIKFRTPVRYISHYPKQMASEIRIKIDVHNIINDSDNSNTRESLIPHNNDNYGLEEVIYEKTQKELDTKREHYLTLFFSREVSFEIIQDASYRSLSLIIHNAE